MVSVKAKMHKLYRECMEKKYLPCFEKHGNGEQYCRLIDGSEATDYLSEGCVDCPYFQIDLGEAI